MADMENTRTLCPKCKWFKEPKIKGGLERCGLHRVCLAKGYSTTFRKCNDFEPLKVESCHSYSVPDKKVFDCFSSFVINIAPVQSHKKEELDKLVEEFKKVKNIHNVERIKDKYKNDLDKHNIDGAFSELRTVKFLSAFGLTTDPTARTLSNGNRIDCTITFNSNTIHVENLYMWKEKQDFLQYFYENGIAGVRSIQKLKNRIGDKKCQFSKDTPHVLIFDSSDSTMDMFPIIHGVSEFSRAFYCEALPDAHAGLFDEKDSSDNYKYENISAALHLKNSILREVVINPNCKNKLPDEFITLLRGKLS